MRIIKHNLILILILFFSVNILVAQEINKTQQLEKQEISQVQEAPKSEARLVDSYQWVGSDEASVRIDYLRQEVRKSPNCRGFIIIYCGKTCQYGEVEAHLRGIKLALKLKGVDEKKFSIILGGFQEQTTTEYWVVPENACPPIPNSKVDIQNVKFKGTFKRKIVPYECCE